MTKSLIQLPDIIFTLIQTFLSYDDYHYFLNTSKLHLSHLKRRTIMFRLTERRSEQYMEDKEFQGLLLSKVEDGWKQIRINVLILHHTSSYDATVPHDSSYFDIFLAKLSSGERTTMTTPPVSLKLKELHMLGFTHLKDVSNLSHLSKLYISYSPQLEDISPLKNVCDLTFYNCPALSDLSMFCGDKNKVISLILCKELSDIRSLSNFRRVSVTSCSSLEDVSPLRGVYDEVISFCSRVKDISGLGGHHRLEISYCSYNLIGYSSLIGVSAVKLSKCDISDLSVLRYAKSVELRSCKEVKDVSPIKNTRRVILTSNRFIENISELSHVYDLSIQQMSMNEKDIQGLSNHKLEIDLSKNGNITNVFFPNTKHLVLHKPPREFDPTCYQHLQSIYIDNANSLCTIKGFEEIPTVRLINMWALIDISGLGRNRYVELKNCPLLKDVSSLANVCVVRIEECRNILDFNVLVKVPRLKIIENQSNRWK